MTSITPGVDRYMTAFRAATGLAVLDGETWEGATVPPLIALKGAIALRREAEYILTAQLQDARRAGHSWQDIGECLGYGKDAATGTRAYEALILRPERHAGWVCATCGQHVTDGYPDEPPASAESGHATDCARLTANIAAWEASRR